ncbi:IS66 family insertion sequence element accessory protein TnpB [Aeromonas caviae]|nr:IS66 family insertion sequence element accessory protein TnpB [Aeromonas caviae]UDN25704.1 IS66 family insertion sequence element accessory protein TnpB [Aeromonas caviae]
MVFLLMGGAYLRSRIKQAGKWDQETIVSFFLCQYCSGEYLQAHGLAALVEQQLGHNPFTGALYAFTNRRRNKIKCLMWEDNGFVLYYKALAEEKFKWPSSADELLSLSSEQINWLLDGYDISLMQGHKTLHYETL